MSMPTFAPLEEWTRSQVQELMQSVLEEEVTHVLGRARYERRASAGRRRGRLGDTWHLDEVFVTIQGRQQYLWRSTEQL